MKYKAATFSENMGYAPVWKTTSGFLPPLPRLVDRVCKVFRNGEFISYFLLNSWERGNRGLRGSRKDGALCDDSLLDVSECTPALLQLEINVFKIKKSIIYV